MEGCGPTASQSETPTPAASTAYFSTNQQWLEGLSTDLVDLEDVDAVFWLVFSQLPDEVTVYPSENYYYYILCVEGRQFWGNIRLAAGHREQGLLSFAYFEFDEFPGAARDGLTRSKMFSGEDGVIVEELDRFTYTVSHKDKEVIFNLYKLPQNPPKLFSLGEDEVFVERTFDESGYQFFVIFNEKKNYFFWILNEEDDLTDILEPVGDDGEIVVGRRSGFAFWIDTEYDNRKVLLGIRQLSVRRNDYYDGPFDQLADNYAEEARISEYMQRAFPALEGRIDQFGYYTDTERPLRVAITTYITYYSLPELEEFMQRAKASADPYWYISRRGVPVPTDPQTQPTKS